MCSGALRKFGCSLEGSKVLEQNCHMLCSNSTITLAFRDSLSYSERSSSQVVLRINTPATVPITSISFLNLQRLLSS